jgi:predicted MFS family arabinose efflux permease
VLGRLIDRVPLKRLQTTILLLQVPMLLLASQAQGWWLFAALLATMVMVFGAIPFTDAVIVRYVDDRMRSRVAGMRLTVSVGISSLAVAALGPAVKAAGFGTLLVVLAVLSLTTAAIVSFLPEEQRG